MHLGKAATKHPHIVILERAREVLRQYWGYESFRPLQEEAVESVLSGRDSIVVLPTGGGKSICFQVPAVIMPGLAIVVSPLISLMKDQIDGLIECGVPAARLDSTLSFDERDQVKERLRNGELKLLYLSPERIVLDNFIALLKTIELSFIAVDEAHCVSQWGHDFRPEYRQLNVLRANFPKIAVHAYTATATDQVREDISKQLSLNDPKILVGSFHRQNLIYKAKLRTNRLQQVCEVLERHKGESGIIYCIRRSDVDGLCKKLNELGYKARPYHAGMSDIARKKNQDAFIMEECEIIVATVAFGMGIDKSNVRFVIHAGMPKSLEHYQQESGRAGRDGLEAECILFFSGGDYGVWKSIITDSEPSIRQISMSKLSHMYEYCTGIACRHKTLVGYFGQELAKENCGACDACLGEIDLVEEPLIDAQKILSCVARLKDGFGADYTAAVLLGSKDARILQNGHNSLSTYGLMSHHTKNIVRDWIEQLVAQEYIQRIGDFKVLRLTEKGWQVLKGKDTPRLLKPAKKMPKEKLARKLGHDSLADIDKELFEQLRRIRRELADKKHVPAYIVFSDATLRDMARKRPVNLDDMLSVSGVGEVKLKQYGEVFLKAINK